MLGLEETSPGVWALSQLDILGGNPINRYIQGFGQDDSGELYVLTKRTQPVTAPDPATGLPSGAILKIVPVPSTTSLTLTAAKDNTLFQEAELSNGAGDWIFAGATDPSKNNAAMRRALLGWNLATVPAGAIVASASVTLKMDRTIAPAYLFSLHKVTTNWGEGTSNAATQEGDGAVASATDATWLKPFFGQATPWTNPGGDFETRKSATLSVGGASNYIWTGPGLAADANAWLANPAGNFGWLLKADLESAVKTGTGASGQLAITVSDTDDLVAGMVVSGTGLGPGAKIAAGGINSSTNVLTLTAPNASAVSGTIYFAAPSAKRFASRSTALSTSRPRLILTYVPVPAPPSHRKAWELTSYLTGQFIEDTYDTDGDGIPDGVEYAWGFPPRTPNDPAAGFTVNPAGVNTGGPVILTFRRDPLAIDLTYRAQVSTDLSNWSDLATSTAGGAPSGIGFVSEAVVDTVFRHVTVHDNVPQGTTRRLYRLKITR